MPRRATHVLGPDQTDRDIAARIRERRCELQLTQTQLGQALGLSFQQIQVYEYATHRISVRALVKVAAALGVSVGVLVGEAPLADSHLNNDLENSEAQLALAGAVDLLAAFAKIDDNATRRSLLLLAHKLAAGAETSGAEVGPPCGEEPLGP